MCTGAVRVQVLCEFSQLRGLALDDASDMERVDSWRRLGTPSYNAVGFHSIASPVLRLTALERLTVVNFTW